MQKELAHRDEKEKKNEECEEKVTASHRPTNPFDVFISPHVLPPYHHYPMTELEALKKTGSHLPNPEEASNRFSTELITFCKEFSPTMHELRRLLAVKLGASNWHKVSGKLRGEDYRRASSSWTYEANANYCTAVAELAEAIKVAFPARVDTARIGNCCQTREESIQDYYHRLYKTFNKHSGLEEPDKRGDQPGIWESHL
ncbi:hypothetical protein M9458_051877 [Cirrhinus mrigala]|uniref:Uncharacterized protein n=1 Tax=Cirrhinus mrigala TaxID=683832 RepID=A0ABD0MVI1_CIRMR